MRLKAMQPPCPRCGLEFVEFWSYVQMTDSCWIWNGYRDKTGYGRMTYEGKAMLTHRLAWIITFGNIPSKKNILHICDNPPCVNPAHLYVGTQAENVRDRVIRGRSNYNRGEQCFNSKLNPSKVQAIRRKYSTEKVSTYKLGEEFGVSHHTIRKVVQRRTWAHVP